MDTWEFEYGAAENDPEFGSAVQRPTKDDEITKDQEDYSDSGGKWVHRVTADVLGGNGALIEFTVIGYVLWTIQVIQRLLTHPDSRSRTRCYPS